MSTITTPSSPVVPEGAASVATGLVAEPELAHVLRVPEPGRVRPVDRWALARVATDAFAVVAATLLVLGAQRTLEHPVWLLGAPVLTFAALALGELSTPRLRALAGQELRRVLRTAAVITMAACAAALVVGAGAQRLQDVVKGGLAAAAALAVSRLALASSQSLVRRRTGASRRTLIIGAGRVGHLTAARLAAEPTLGLRPLGFLDKEPMADGEEGPHLPVFGASWDLERTITEQRIETVVVAFSTAPNHVPLAIVRRCWELKVPVILIPRLFEVQGVRTVTEHLGGLPLLTLNPANPRGWELRVRYAVDRVLGALGVLLLAPLLLGLALAVRLTLGSPVLFRQPRMGRDGLVFDMLKFRTMWGSPARDGEQDAGWASRAMRSPAGNGNGEPSATTGTAPVTDRRTPLGRFMRRWSLDELPQLLNVVRGDMALIGPRPERAHYANEFEKAVYRYRDRARIKPGITGWAQVNGLRGQTSLADRVEWDNFYIENWSPWLDAKILLMTVPYALRHRD